MSNVFEFGGLEDAVAGIECGIRLLTHIINMISDNGRDVMEATIACISENVKTNSAQKPASGEQVRGAGGDCRDKYVCRLSFQHQRLV